ncbi:hypothetical protein F5H01DRAFT_343704 [Linnemannia elongata]|nr:hypothetical protein F5H01DRAFT_343704 [Linnemannia elongata]
MTVDDTVDTGDSLAEDPSSESREPDNAGSLALEEGEDSVATPVGSGNTPATVPSGRWTTAEHHKCIAALKKYGRDFEAVANAVGTKTVDQCKNFCFNYKRKFGVSVLEDANNLDIGTLLEEGDDKDVPVAAPEKTKGKKGRGGNAAASTSVPGTPNSLAGTTKEISSTGNSRRKGGKAAPAAQEPVKDELPGTPTAQATVPVNTAESVEDSETGSNKRRRKRVVSKNEAVQNEGASAQAATSFRALYSRDPPSSPGSPSISGTQSEDGQATNADGSSRRANYSSYWSSQEKIDFMRLLSLHGKDWDKIAKAMKTKSLIQVRNYFSTNADKFAADGIIPPDRVAVSPLPPHKEEQMADGDYDYQHQRDQTPNEQGRGRAFDYGAPGDDSHHPQQPHPGGPVPGYFMPSAPQESKPELVHREEPRPISPPRRVTNIGNLLNNDDEDVNVAPEDWFGNSEEGSAPQSQEHSFEGEVPERQDSRQNYPQEPYVDGRGGRREEEDVETEDEYDSTHRGQGMYADNRVPNRDQRRASETNLVAARSGYPPSGSGYYGHSHPSQLAPPPPQQHLHHSSNSGVLGSPYGAQPYYSSSSPSHLGSGYRSPPPSTGYPLGVSGHGMQRLSSPSGSLPPAPSSAVISPSHYPASSMSISQHQRSSSVSLVEMAPRSQLSPRMDSRARSPMPQQGAYYGPPSHGQSSRHGHGHGHAPYPPQHHSQQRHSNQMEVLSPHPRTINEPPMILQHSSSMGPSPGHGHSQSHVGPGPRYSSSPQLPGSGGMRGSPGPAGFPNGASSPAHLGHGGHLASRYSPIPMSSSSTPGLPSLVGIGSSPRMSEPPMQHHHHHPQHPSQHHVRRSSSPFQHHVPGQVASPSYIQPMSGMHPSSSSKPMPSSSSFAYSSASSASLLPPPLPPSSSSSSSMGPSGYHSGGHPHQQQQQQSSSYGHAQHSQQQHPYGHPPPPHHHHTAHQQQQQQQSSRHHHPQ